MKTAPASSGAPLIVSPNRRCRVISDNDYAGDPDGLYQLAHLLLSPSVDLNAVIGSHLAPGDPFDSSEATADHAVREIEAILELLGMRDRVRSVAGSNARLVDAASPADSAGARAIVQEAMRTDTDLPLYVTFGGGLTELASAYLMEPAIAGRLTAVWIGGPEHDELWSPPITGADLEYNLNIDLTAAQVVFNDSPIELWQIPRNVYRQCVVSTTELAARVAPMGALGAHLHEKIRDVVIRAGTDGWNTGETFILGDNPLVLLTALQSSFHPETTSSRWVPKPTPQIDDDGRYRANPAGREMRVYTWLDTRLMLEDLFLKLQLAAVERPG